MARMPRLFGLVTLVAVTALLGAACSSASSSGSQHVAKQGGILRIGTTEGIDSLNPFVGFNQDSYSTWFYVYPSLVQYDLHTYKFIPNFATSWQTSPDGLTWTFHLAPNAKWSDGKQLTAADVAWTVNTMIKYQNGPRGCGRGALPTWPVSRPRAPPRSLPRTSGRWPTCCRTWASSPSFPGRSGDSTPRAT